MAKAKTKQGEAQKSAPRLVLQHIPGTLDVHDLSLRAQGYGRAVTPGEIAALVRLVEDERDEHEADLKAGEQRDKDTSDEAAKELADLQEEYDALEKSRDEERAERNEEILGLETKLDRLYEVHAVVLNERDKAEGERDALIETVDSLSASVDTLTAAVDAMTKGETS